MKNKFFTCFFLLGLVSAIPGFAAEQCQAGYLIFQSNKNKEGAKKNQVEIDVLLVNQHYAPYKYSPHKSETGKVCQVATASWSKVENFWRVNDLGKSEKGFLTQLGLKKSSTADKMPFPRMGYATISFLNTQNVKLTLRDCRTNSAQDTLFPLERQGMVKKPCS